MGTSEQRRGLLAGVTERMHDPFQLRLMVTALILVVALAGLYMPLSQAIEDESRQLAKEEKRLDLALELERLRKQRELFEHRIPQDADVNEWVQYVLDGIRKFPLKLAKLESADVRSVGPYKAVVLRVELEGVFHDMDGFLRWVEANDRLFRLDEVQIAPTRSNKDKQIMELTMLGVMS